MLATEQDLHERLAELGIACTTRRRPALRTVEESKCLHGDHITILTCRTVPSNAGNDEHHASTVATHSVSCDIFADGDARGGLMVRRTEA